LKNILKNFYAENQKKKTSEEVLKKVELEVTRLVFVFFFLSGLRLIQMRHQMTVQMICWLILQTVGASVSGS